MSLTKNVNDMSNIKNLFVSYEAKNNKLIERAKYFLGYGYSESYVQSKMYAERNHNTGIRHIREAIEEAIKLI